MEQIADAKAVEQEGEYVTVRFRDPDVFQTVREPNWAQWVAGYVSSGARVRVGKEPESEKWTVQSVLVEHHVGETRAREQAKRIAEKINFRHARSTERV